MTGEHDGRNYIRDLWTSARSQPARALLRLSAAVGATWTIVQPAAFFFDWVEERRMLLLVVTAMLVAAVWIRTTHLTRRHVIERAGTRVEVFFGEFFETEGVHIVAVNDFFDSQLGNNVAESSLHGQVIVREFSSNANDFRATVDRALKGRPSTPSPRPSGRQNRYTVGETATIRPNGNCYVLVALGHTNAASAKVRTRIVDLATALASVWPAARAASNGEAIVCPLMGAGLAGVSMTTTQLTNLLLASLLEASGEQKVATTVRVVLPESEYGRINLDQDIHSH